ncbi:MAG: 50S ribosomal protein L29 [Holosporales bacterium]|jgi:ribosomal protein L29|nr:50S ribosomal protein L29 [Holosporales bacterium]
MAKKKDQKQAPEKLDAFGAKKEIAKMRFRRAMGESVASHRFRELRRSIAVELTTNAKMKEHNA